MSFFFSIYYHFTLEGSENFPMAPQLRGYVAGTRAPASGLCIWYSPRYVLFQQSLRWKHWCSLGLRTLCPVAPKQPGQGGWRETGFLKILKPHSHTSLTPSLPKHNVVFSCVLFTNSDLGSYRSSCFQLQELGWVWAETILFTPNLKCSNRMAGPSRAELRVLWSLRWIYSKFIITLKSLKMKT